MATQSKSKSRVKPPVITAAQLERRIRSLRDDVHQLWKNNGARIDGMQEDIKRLRARLDSLERDLNPSEVGVSGVNDSFVGDTAPEVK